jgi:hypothetical protein
VLRKALTADHMFGDLVQMLSEEVEADEIGMTTAG